MSEKSTNKGHQAYFHHPQRPSPPQFIPPPVQALAAPDGLTVDHLPTADLKLVRPGPMVKLVHPHARPYPCPCWRGARKMVGC